MFGQGTTGIVAFGILFQRHSVVESRAMDTKKNIEDFSNVFKAANGMVDLIKNIEAALDKLDGMFWSKLIIVYRY